MTRTKSKLKIQWISYSLKKRCQLLNACLEVKFLCITLQVSWRCERWNCIVHARRSSVAGRVCSRWAECTWITHARVVKNFMMTSLVTKKLVWWKYAVRAINHILQFHDDERANFNISLLVSPHADSWFSPFTVKSHLSRFCQRGVKSAAPRVHCTESRGIIQDYLNLSPLLSSFIQTRNKSTIHTGIWQVRIINCAIREFYKLF